jgi:hypothetical protein
MHTRRTPRTPTEAALHARFTEALVKQSGAVSSRISGTFRRASGAFVWLVAVTCMPHSMPSAGVPRMEVDPETALVDEPVQVRVRDCPQARESPSRRPLRTGNTCFGRQRPTLRINRVSSIREPQHQKPEGATWD